jgi:malonyl CoA-acyl carrier protein transacylase
MRAGLFPGQGLDPGSVASALGETDPILERARDVLGYDIRRKVDQVTRRSRPVLPTSVAQPAIFLAGLIAFRTAFDSGDRFAYLAGHSLGEYTALVAANSIPFTDGLRLVAARGEAMQKASSLTAGGMAAVMNLSPEDIDKVCHETGISIANDNSPTQVVLSGPEDALADAAQMVKGLGGRAVLLPVDGAYHSDAMEPAVERLARVLEQTRVRQPKVPVVSNVTARPYRAPGEIRRFLGLQLQHKVRFRESIEWLLEQGVTEFTDLGPGRVVERLARATTKNKEVATIA